MGEMWEHVPWTSKLYSRGLHVEMNARLSIFAFKRNTSQRHDVYDLVFLRPHGFLRITF